MAGGILGGLGQINYEALRRMQESHELAVRNQIHAMADRQCLQTLSLANIPRTPMTIETAADALIAIFEVYFDCDVDPDDVVRMIKERFKRLSVLAHFIHDQQEIERYDREECLKLLT